MVSSTYMSGRKKWARPQAIMLSTNSSGISNGVPQVTGTEGEDFIILSDHGRSQITVSPERIENRKRMVNAHMRSYYIADKLKISTSWTMLPSRSYSIVQTFSASSGMIENLDAISYTADGGAGGTDLLRWHESNPGSFYMFLAYDNFDNYDNYSGGVSKLSRYAQEVEVYFSDFSYDIVKRGGSNHDFWDISVSFEEV
jgi:hypothetical protein